MNRIKVFDNYWSRLLCAFLNTPALTLGRWIFLGCYKDRYETLLNETTSYFQNRTIWWYIRDIFWKLLRKEK